MYSEVLTFYALFLSIVFLSLGVVYAPKMFLSILSFSFLIVAFSLLFWWFGAGYIACFIFILCALFLSGFIFILVKKIGILTLNLKMVSVGKVILGSILLFAFAVLGFLFFNEENSESLYSVFSFVSERSSDIMSFVGDFLPLHLVLILVLVAAVVIRVLLTAGNEDSNA